MIVISLGLGTLFDWAQAYHPHGGNVDDPLARCLGVIQLTQLIIGVIGAMFITTEYSTGSIRTTLIAVPRRTLLVMSKLLVMLVSMFILCELLVVSLFFIGQAIFNHQIPSISINYPDALRGVLLTGLYLVILAAIGFGLGLIIRQTAGTIVAFVVLVLILPLLSFALPTSWRLDIQKYLPLQLGSAMGSLNSAPGLFSPWVATLILTLYAFGICAFGLWNINNRDA